METEIEIGGNIKEKKASISFSDLKEIPSIEASLSYNSFFNNYILKNLPCKVVNIGTSWNCSQDWVDGSQPAFHYLASKYGQCETIVYDCREKYFNSQKCDSMLFLEFLKYWTDFLKSNYEEQMPLLYLKDWHLKNQFPDDNFYEVPFYFASDWLNEYLSSNDKDDYRFVYMGPKGTWTPFHVDVFTSFSWSVNICGVKKWIFIPPGEENKLKDKFGNLPYDVAGLLNNVKHFIVLQRAGEAVFVPTNWHHQVWNLEDTISVNHNWINGCNIDTMWHSLSNHLISVKTEIKDCLDMPDFDEHCQRMLKASFGMDYNEFYEFLAFIARKRVDFLKNGNLLTLPEGRILGRNHAIFDVTCINEVVKVMLKDENIKKLRCFQNTSLLDLKADIKSVIS